MFVLTTMALQNIDGFSAFQIKWWKKEQSGFSQDIAACCQIPRCQQNL